MAGRPGSREPGVHEHPVGLPDRHAYDVFISYSRADAPFARKLARALDRYRPPRGIGLPPRTLRVFRDEGDLTGSDYYESIDRYLGQSRALVVLCSPAARGSRYVDDEIRRFAEANGTDRIVPVLLDGIPNNEAGPEDEARKAFPEALCELMELPLATSFLDFDVQRDKPDRSQFQASWYTLLANVCGVSRRAIEQRDVKRRRTRRATVIGTTGAVMAALVALTAFAMIQRGLADTRREQAEGLIDFMLTDLRAKLQPLGRLELLDDVGDEALGYFASLPESEFSDDELLSRSQALYQIGEVRLGQGNLAEAEDAFTESLRLVRELTARDPSDTGRLFGESQSHFWVGYAAWLQRDLLGAESEFQEYMRIAETLVGIDPTNADWRLELAYAHSNLGSAREEQRDLEGAREAFEANLGIMSDLSAQQPDNAGLGLEVAVAHNKLGVVLQKLGDLSGALEQFEANLTVMEPLSSADRSNATFRDQLGLGHLYLGNVRRLLGDANGALESFSTYERAFDELVELDEENLEWAFSRAHARRQMSLALLDLGDLAAATTQATAALAMYEQLAMRDPDRFEPIRDGGRARWLLGRIRLEGGQLEEALQGARASASMLESMLESGVQPEQVGLWIGESRLLEGDVLDRMGRRDEAAASWRLALARTEGNSAGQADILDLRARALSRLGRAEEAREVLADLDLRGYRSPELEAVRG